MPERLTCYNRGCGQEYDPSKNTDESCTYHPGVPFFHDVYKGWTCCNKKSVDFTEFLNIKGCTKGEHSNVKPPEPEKPNKETINEADNLVEEPQKIPEPIAKPKLVRPPFESPLKTIAPTVAPAFKKQIDELLPEINANAHKQVQDSSIVQPGTACKHAGCTYTYKDTEEDDGQCVYHPGVPIFHEGMKFWSCCQRKTSDFTAFMNQVGCETGSHKWISDEDASKSVQCRLDWHQTATQVVVAVYAKLYHYERSVVQLNPIRLRICLVFPKQNNQEYNADLELRGVVDVDQCKVQMFGTKVEITLIKAEPGSWQKLDFPRPTASAGSGAGSQKKEDDSGKTKDVQDSDSDVDLGDIEPAFGSARLTEIK